ncbi:hypothetical protein MRX96_044043 [Rhipicephalus microplus]
MLCGQMRTMLERRPGSGGDGTSDEVGRKTEARRPIWPVLHFIEREGSNVGGVLMPQRCVEKNISRMRLGIVDVDHTNVVSSAASVTGCMSCFALRTFFSFAAS